MTLPERLARELIAACPRTTSCDSLERQIAAAIRAALDEAARAARACETTAAECSGECRQDITAAIEALKGPAPRNCLYPFPEHDNECLPPPEDRR